MKIRTGFVSNSSSSSFCVAKCFIPKEDLQEFQRLVDEYNDEDSHGEGTEIDNDNHYFCGELNQNSPTTMLEFLDKKKIPYYIG